MTDNKEQISTKVRSTSYPAIDLSDAIERVENLKIKLGHNVFSRETAATALGYSGLSGKSSVVVAGLVHFGLLTRHADTYRVSELTYEILTFKDESEKKEAIVKAAVHPKLYNKLIDTYSGKSIPTMLDHILARDYGINEKVASVVVKTFVASMTFAGLLVNGILRSPEEASKEHSDPEVKQSDPGSGNQKKLDGRPSTYQEIVIRPGIILSYAPELAFSLFTNATFTSKLKELQDALAEPDAVSAHSKGGNVEEQDNGSR